jgi:hypothetical protein
MTGMEFFALRNGKAFGLSIVIALIVTGCEKSSEHHPSRIAAPLPLLDWNQKTLTDAYDTNGNTNPLWDEPAKRALAEFVHAHSESISANEDWAAIISSNSTAAINAGCDDPMVRFFYVHYGMDQKTSKEEFTEAYCAMASNLEKSSYPSFRKFYAWQNAGDQVHYAYGYTNYPSKFSQMGIWAHAEADLLDAISDVTMPPEEAYNACREMLNDWNGVPDHYAALYEKIKNQLPDHWDKAPIFLLLQGQTYVNMAWQARGNDYADSVTKEGGKLFEKRLDVAEDSLDKAWKLNPKDPRIPREMIKVEMGQGRGRDRMEMWFQRAMDLDPNYYDACHAKLLYIEPKWYGSIQDMLDFGRECVRNQKWGGQIPLILLDAHQDIQSQFVTGEMKTNYWKQPQVWNDLKSAFDRYFIANPDNIGWYHNYAWFAFQAEQWNTFIALLPKLGPINYGFFGGKDKFDEMVAIAKQHASQVEKN